MVSSPIRLIVTTSQSDSTAGVTKRLAKNKAMRGEEGNRGVAPEVELLLSVLFRNQKITHKELFIKEKPRNCQWKCYCLLLGAASNTAHT
jgi:hypothetical protein